MMPDPAKLPLRDLHLPDSISWWPLAPGWWLTLVFVLLMVGAVLAIRYWIKRGRLKRFALTELDRLEQRYQANNEDLQPLVQALSILFRRLALTLYPPQETASLTGEQWLQRLDSALEKTSEANAFSSGVGRVLIEAPYNPNCPIDRPALLALTRFWIERATRRGGRQ